MVDRPIKGTIGRQASQVLPDIPSDATGIFFGVLLDRSERVWMNSVKFEVVGTEVPTTGSETASATR